MNIIRAEREVFNAMVKGDRVCSFPVDENRIFVTHDGYMGYIFPVSSISFNLGRCMDMVPLKYAELVKPENELFLTDYFRAGGFGDKRMYRRLKAKGKNVFVNNAFLANFQNPRFWQDKNSTDSLITVTEKGATPRQDIPVGVILPVRRDWSNDFREDGEPCG